MPRFCLSSFMHIAHPLHSPICSSFGHCNPVEIIHCINVNVIRYHTSFRILPQQTASSLHQPNIHVHVPYPTLHCLSQPLIRVSVSLSLLFPSQPPAGDVRNGGEMYGGRRSLSSVKRRSRGSAMTNRTLVIGAEAREGA